MGGLEREGIWNVLQGECLVTTVDVQQSRLEVFEESLMQTVLWTWGNKAYALICHSSKFESTISSRCFPGIKRIQLEKML